MGSGGKNPNSRGRKLSHADQGATFLIGLRLQVLHPTVSKSVRVARKFQNGAAKSIKLRFNTVKIT